MPGDDTSRGTMGATRVHVLCDNHSRGREFGFEHGLSMCLDLPCGQRWLWDTGQTGLFLDNARKMGIDPASFQGLALSHGHYDHTGGLRPLLLTGFRGPVHAHEAFATRRWKADGQGVPTHIGLDASNLPDPLPGLIPVCGLSRPAPGLTMVTDIPRAPGRHQSVDGFFLDTALKRPDPMPDDACLVLDTAGGPVVLLGCCHSGLANTLHHVRETLGLDAVHAVAGGFHLHNTRPEAVDEAIETLDDFDVRRVMPCHCTSPAATEALTRALPGRVRPLAAGDVMEF